MAEIASRPALAGLEPVRRADGLELRAGAARTLYWLQLSLDDGVPPRLEHVVGDGGLPLQPNTASGEDPAALWLAPGEWLLALRSTPPADVERRIDQSLAGRPYALNDVGHALQILELHGPGAGALLARGCGLDLHPRAFAPGRCARTRFAQIGLLLHLQADGSRFDLYVDRSHARYLWNWLVDAGFPSGG